MTMWREIHSSRYLIGRLQHGSDLLDEVTRICKEENIQLGRVEALGAVSKARIAYYDQEARDYRFIEMDREGDHKTRRERVPERGPTDGPCTRDARRRGQGLRRTFGTGHGCLCVRVHHTSFRRGLVNTFPGRGNGPPTLGYELRG